MSGLVGAEVPRNACTAPSVGACCLGAIELTCALSAVEIMDCQYGKAVKTSTAGSKKI